MMTAEIAETYGINIVLCTLEEKIFEHFSNLNSDKAVSISNVIMLLMLPTTMLRAFKTGNAHLLQ